MRVGAPRAPGAGRGTGGGGGGAGCRGGIAFRHRLLSHFLGAHHIFLGQALAEGKRGTCNEPPPRGLRTGKPGKMHAAMI